MLIPMGIWGQNEPFLKGERARPLAREGCCPWHGRDAAHRSSTHWTGRYFHRKAQLSDRVLRQDPEQCSGARGHPLAAAPRAEHRPHELLLGNPPRALVVTGVSGCPSDSTAALQTEASQQWGQENSGKCWS